MKKIMFGLLLVVLLCSGFYAVSADGGSYIDENGLAHRGDEPSPFAGITNIVFNEDGSYIDENGLAHRGTFVNTWTVDNYNTEDLKRSTPDTEINKLPLEFVSQQPTLSYSQDEETFDKELGFDMRPKTFSESFKYYLTKNEKDYEIYYVTEYEYKGYKFIAYYLTNDVLITGIINSLGNIACFQTGANQDVSEIYSLDVMIDIFKSAVYPYPEDWREVFQRVYDLRPNKEIYNYGELSLYKLADDEGMIFYAFAPVNYLVP